jgi:hypothetical protein
VNVFGSPLQPSSVLSQFEQIDPLMMLGMNRTLGSGEAEGEGGEATAG